MSTQHVLSLEINHQGRDFIVGDIHGMFSAFDQLLKKVTFIPEIDRVISVGDLIDRGQESHKVLEYLNQSWFFSIKGNHEQMCLDAAHNQEINDSWIYINGGGWWDSVEYAEQQAIRKAFSSLATIAEISTNNGTIGVVHADISPHSGWDTFKQQITTDTDLRHFARWSRARYDRFKAAGTNENIRGVKFVVAGHTPITQWVDAGNVRFIDTGAPYTQTKGLGKMTLMQIQPTIKMFVYNTRT